MLQVIPKWRVTVTLGGHEQAFWISDNHISNVLRHVASMDFSENGLLQPKRIVIEPVAERQVQSGTFVTE